MNYTCYALYIDNDFVYNFEMWDSHNHAKVYVCDHLLFDGYFCEAVQRLHTEMRNVYNMFHTNGFNVAIKDRNGNTLDLEKTAFLS